MIFLKVKLKLKLHTCYNRVITAGAIQHWRYGGNSQELLLIDPLNSNSGVLINPTMCLYGEKKNKFYPRIRYVPCKLLLLCLNIGFLTCRFVEGFIATRCVNDDVICAVQEYM